MKSIVVPTFLAALSALPAAPVQAAAKIALTSIKLALPDDSRLLPDGAGADAVNGNCLACHSASMILTQPALTKPQWEAEVAKMRNVYKAPIDPKDVDAIVAYLAALKPGD